MKRYTLFIVAFVAAFSLIAGPAFSAAYVTPKIDLGFGISEFHTDGDVNPGIGGGLILGFNVAGSISLEGQAAFQYWFFDVEDAAFYFVPFTVGLRFGLGESFGLIGGLGGCWRQLDTDVGSADDTDFTFYLGAEILFSQLSLRIKYVYISEDFWNDSSSIQASIGYRISM